ncbi:hypothetical protein KEF85_05915 [Methylomonas paludis]|uniref:Uncharacterized protein n=1 Tax=Methylomonas paludis TaxID=1173101 RepID=A0A975RA14_9GAMM|nr:hypothetical protein [Methylomonas paludis]QWF71990.1 hypothetical protein KEF85_05915 [Methylomonas paludis]
MGLQDSKLLVAGTINPNVSAQTASASNPPITGQDLTGVTAGTVTLSQYSIDLNPVAGTGIDIGEGAPLFLKWLITTAFTGATGLTIAVVTADNSGLSTNLTTLNSQAAPALTAGTFGYLPIPPQIASGGASGLGQEFIGATFTPTGGTVTAGKIVAEITNQVDDPKSFYKSGFTVA